MLNKIKETLLKWVFAVVVVFLDSIPLILLCGMVFAIVLLLSKLVG